MGCFLQFCSVKDWTIATEFRDRRQREERKHRLNREIMAPEVRVSGPENEPAPLSSSLSLFQL